MGTKLREIIYDIGGGISGGRDFKAVQTGVTFRRVYHETTFGYPD